MHSLQFLCTTLIQHLTGRHLIFIKLLLHYFILFHQVKKSKLRLFDFTMEHPTLQITHYSHGNTSQTNTSPTQTMPSSPPSILFYCVFCLLFWCFSSFYSHPIPLSLFGIYKDISIIVNYVLIWIILIYILIILYNMLMQSAIIPYCLTFPLATYTVMQLDIITIIIWRN